MPTLWSNTLIPTSRQVPAEAEVPSHKLMLRAGLIRKLGSGVYDYLPLGLRSLRKAMAIVREEMDAAGAVEVMLPTLAPIELWERTGRRTDYGQNLFVVKDRHGRESALGPTHEEVVTELVGGYIESYKQLPLTLYQIQTKFRDEFRPRFGVLRSREFQMKDAYSFHTALEGPGGLDETYTKQFNAYCRIFTRCGLPYEVVEAESGPIGGSASHEFMVPSPTGEDLILKSDATPSDGQGYAANVEKCEIGKRKYDLDGEPTGDLEEVHTPDCPGIDDVITFFKKSLKTKLKPQNMLKSLLFESVMSTEAESKAYLQSYQSDAVITSVGQPGAHILAVVRGDHEVNEAKLWRELKSKFGSLQRIELMQEHAVSRYKYPVGYIGPHYFIQKRGPMPFVVVVDLDAAQGGFWVAGANEPDGHVKHFNWRRDVIEPLGNQADKGVIVADIRNAVDGDPAPDGGTLRATKGIEIGHVFKLGDKYSRALDVSVRDEKNEDCPVLMGCYGIGVNRILAAAIEREGGHDDNGIIWPAAIAPYTVLITPIKYEDAMRETADRLAAELEQIPGVDVLIDDRDDRPGVKFKDADLIGIPVRITIGEKALADGEVEIKPRTESEATRVKISEAAGWVEQWWEQSKAQA